MSSVRDIIMARKARAAKEHPMEAIDAPFKPPQVVTYQGGEAPGVASSAPPEPARRPARAASHEPGSRPPRVPSADRSRRQPDPSRARQASPARAPVERRKVVRASSARASDRAPPSVTDTAQRRGPPPLPKGNRGKVPQYLQKRKAEMEQQKRAEEEDLKRERPPAGFRIVSEDERVATLEFLNGKLKEQEKLREQLPLRIVTDRAKKQEVEIKEKVASLEAAVDKFSRAKVLVPAHEKPLVEGGSVAKKAAPKEPEMTNAEYAYAMAELDAEMEEIAQLDRALEAHRRGETQGKKQASRPDEWGGPGEDEGRSNRKEMPSERAERVVEARLAKYREPSPRDSPQARTEVKVAQPPGGHSNFKLWG